MCSLQNLRYRGSARGPAPLLFCATCDTKTSEFAVLYSNTVSCVSTRLPTALSTSMWANSCASGTRSVGSSGTRDRPTNRRGGEK